jgi:hypothetical protein
MVRVRYFTDSASSNPILKNKSEEAKSDRLPGITGVCRAID